MADLLQDYAKKVMKEEEVIKELPQEVMNMPKPIYSTFLK